MNITSLSPANQNSRTRIVKNSGQKWPWANDIDKDIIPAPDSIDSTTINESALTVKKTKLLDNNGYDNSCKIDDLIYLESNMDYDKQEKNLTDDYFRETLVN